MEVKDLTFSMNESGRYSAQFTTSGTRTVLQMDREKGGTIIVQTRVPGMTDFAHCAIFYYGNQNYSFEVNLPEGIEVRVQSYTKITEAKILVE